MSKKVTVETLWNVLREIENGAKDKSRTINSISDGQVKEIVSCGAEIGIKAGLGVGTASAIGAAGLGAAGFVGGGAYAYTAVGLCAYGKMAGLGAVGAVAGSAVPVIGTLIGLGVGLGIGALVAWKTKRKNENEKQRLNQELMAKQNGVIKQLKEEVEELRKNNHLTKEQNKRYEYIIGSLTVNEELLLIFRGAA